MQTKYSAYLTIYLSLIFGIVLSLLFVFVEGAAIGAVRAQAELVADLGLDSVFAEYHRELLEQYELFYVDSSYGGVNGGIGMVEKHLSDYMEYNLNPEKDLHLLGQTTLLKLINPYLEIAEVSCASDDNCMVWKAQAVNYMKAVYGGDLAARVREQMDIVQSNGLDEKDVAGALKAQKQEFEETLLEKGIVEYGAESEEGYSYQKVSGMFDKIIGEGILALVMPEHASISGAVMEGGPYFSVRKKNGNINRGIGLHEGADRPDGLADELIYGAYLMKMCGNYRAPKNEGLLKYQTEYILCGYKSDTENLRGFVERLFALRAAANFIAISGDHAKRSEVELVSAVLCTLLTVPELTDLLTEIILGMWAFAESVIDVRQLLDGGRIALIKNSGDWSTSLSGLLKGNLSGGSNHASGLSYQDYLSIFLGLMNRDTKVARSLDIVEMDLRKTDGNEHFRIDRCMDYIKVHFGFDDDGGHEFVLSRKMCYSSESF